MSLGGHVASESKDEWGHAKKGKLSQWIDMQIKHLHILYYIIYTTVLSIHNMVNLSKTLKSMKIITLKK